MLVQLRTDAQGPTHDASHADASFGKGALIKQTTSLCPTCLERIPAAVYAREEQVWMDKSCPDHGPWSALLADDVNHYYKYDARMQGVGSCCGPGQHCGDQVANHSCNMLIEITQRCNLSCPTCYAGSGPDRHETITLERYKELVDALLAKGKGDADLIQLSGGEPTVHPDLLEMIAYALERGVKQVYINTNGIKLAGKKLAEAIAGFGSRVQIYLQFDGLRPETSELLRGRADLVETKLKALANCERLGISTVPIMTMTRGVNDDELGALIKLALDHPRAVGKIMIQPAMYSGRYENPRLIERLTVADVAKAFVAQTDGLFCEQDFGPIPCSDPNCFSMALALRLEDRIVPISRFFPRYENWADAENASMVGNVTDTFDSAEDLEAMMSFALSSGALDRLDEDQVDDLLTTVMLWRAEQAKNAGPYRGLFAIGIKPFMDAYTYDQDRIDKCCVHIINHAGEPVSFCEYNALHRPTGRA